MATVTYSDGRTETVTRRSDGTYSTSQTPSTSSSPTHETAHAPPSSTATHEAAHTTSPSGGTVQGLKSTGGGGSTLPPAPTQTPSPGVTLKSKIDAGTASPQEQAMFARQTAFDRYGNTQQPYYTDRTGRKWTESHLDLVDPTEAAALRYASATGKPAPRITTYRPEQRPKPYHGDVVFLPDTRQTPPLRNRAQIQATSSRAQVIAGISAAEAAKSQGYAERASKKTIAFNKKWGAKKEITAAEAYEYTQDRQKLEAETTPLIIKSQASYTRSGVQYQKAQKLAEQANKSRVDVAKMEYKAEDDRAAQKYIDEQTGQGYIGGLFKVKEGKSPGAGIRKTNIELSTPAKVIATDTMAGAVIGSKAGAGGALVGAIGGATVAVGDLTGRFVPILSEKYDLPLIGQAKRRVEKVREPDFIIPLIDRKVFLKPDQSVGTKSTVEPPPSFDVQLGLELTPEGDSLKVADAVLVNKTKYRTVSKTEDISKRTQLAGELGAVAGAFAAPHVTRYGLETIHKIKKVVPTMTKAGAVIDQTPKGETRKLASQTKAIREKPVGSRKLSQQLDSITDQQSPAEIGDFKGTGSVKEKVFGSASRTGSPIKYSGELESSKSFVVGDKSFKQVFKTTTTTPSGTSTAYGAGFGARSGDTTLGRNIGVVFQKGKPPGIYDLAYKSQGFTGSPGGTSGNWQPSVITTPKGGGVISSTVERTTSVGFVGTPSIQTTSIIPKVSPTLSPSVSAGAAPGVTNTLVRAAPSQTQITPQVFKPQETVSIQKQRIRQELTPKIATTTITGTVTEGTRVRGTQSVTKQVSIPATVTVPITSTRQRQIPATTQIQIVAQKQIQTPVTAQIQELTPVMDSPVAPSVGFTPRFIPPQIPPTSPPIIPIAPNIPLGRWGIEQKGRARASKKRIPRYAPSVTASVFNIFTTKKQKATGWTGLETRPIVTKKKTKKKQEPLFELGSLKLGGFKL